MAETPQEITNDDLWAYGLRLRMVLWTGRLLALVGLLWWLLWASRVIEAATFSGSLFMTGVTVLPLFVVRTVAFRAMLRDNIFRVSADDLGGIIAVEQGLACASILLLLGAVGGYSAFARTMGMAGAIYILFANVFGSPRRNVVFRNLGMRAGSSRIYSRLRTLRTHVRKVKRACKSLGGVRFCTVGRNACRLFYRASWLSAGVMFGGAFLLAALFAVAQWEIVRDIEGPLYAVSLYLGLLLFGGPHDPILRSVIRRLDELTAEDVRAMVEAGWRGGFWPRNLPVPGKD